MPIAVGIAALFIVGVINEKGIDIRKSLAKKPAYIKMGCISYACYVNSCIRICFSRNRRLLICTILKEL